MSAPTSQWPPREPPQGPLSRRLAQSAIGQMPAVKASRQSPHPRHFSRQTPGSSAPPIKVVVSAGMTGRGSKASATICTPAPHASDKIASVPCRDFQVGFKQIVLALSLDGINEKSGGALDNARGERAGALNRELRRRRRIGRRLHSLRIREPALSVTGYG